MLKTFTIAAIALGTAAVIALPRAHAGLFEHGIQLNGPELQGIQLNGFELQGIQLNGFELQGIQLNGFELQGIQLNGFELQGLSTNGPGLSGQVGPLAPDEAGMRVVALRRPTAAK